MNSSKVHHNFELINGTWIFRGKAIESVDYRTYMNNIRTYLDTQLASEDSMYDYTTMNYQRMQRWDKRLQLNDELRYFLMDTDKTLDFLVITEPWCGDAAHTLPMVQKMVDIRPDFSMNIVHRDENPDIMDEYLTNGNRSIPIVVVFEKERDDLCRRFRWGPKPSPMMKMLQDYKEGRSELSKDDFMIETQKWYNKDASQTTQAEILDLLKKHLSQ